MAFMLQRETAVRPETWRRETAYGEGERTIRRLSMRSIITQTALLFFLGSMSAMAFTKAERVFVGKVVSVDPQAHQLVIT